MINAPKCRLRCKRIQFCFVTRPVRDLHAYSLLQATKPVPLKHAWSPVIDWLITPSLEILLDLWLWQKKLFERLSQHVSRRSWPSVTFGGVPESKKYCVLSKSNSLSKSLPIDRSIIVFAVRCTHVLIASSTGASSAVLQAWSGCRLNGGERAHRYTVDHHSTSLIDCYDKRNLYLRCTSTHRTVAHRMKIMRELCPSDGTTQRLICMQSITLCAKRHTYGYSVRQKLIKRCKYTTNCQLVRGQWGHDHVVDLVSFCASSWLHRRS